MQEKFLGKFTMKLEKCKSSATEKRKLKQPFTDKEAKLNVVQELLNAEELGKKIHCLC